MHEAGANTARACGEWIELAQEHSGLLEAMRKVFGKRLPTPQKLGLWLSSHLAQYADDLILQGQHSARRKAWVYRVASKEKIAAARAQAEARAVVTMQIPIQSSAPLHPAHAPPTAGHFTPLDRNEEKYESRAVIDRATGQIRRELLTDRDGEPIPTHRPAVAAETPKPEPKPEPKPQAVESPARVPKILDGMRWRPMTAEEIERSKPHVVSAGYRFIDSDCKSGFADHGGTVSQNIHVENSRGRNYCRVAGSWSR